MVQFLTYESIATPLCKILLWSPRASRVKSDLPGWHPMSFKISSWHFLSLTVAPLYLPATLMRRHQPELCSGLLPCLNFPYEGFKLWLSSFQDSVLLSSTSAFPRTRCRYIYWWAIESRWWARWSRKAHLTRPELCWPLTACAGLRRITRPLHQLNIISWVW